MQERFIPGEETATRLTCDFFVWAFVGLQGNISV
jgi:hypothetical protein